MGYVLGVVITLTLWVRLGAWGIAEAGPQLRGFLLRKSPLQELLPRELQLKGFPLRELRRRRFQLGKTTARTGTARAAHAAPRTPAPRTRLPIPRAR
jgi:hypothetical protein